MTIITLITDFGLKDGNVGVMKGIIGGIAPQAQVIDLSHLISPQDIREAALILLRSAPYFPPGTIHVVVVDPGVGTSRRPLGARLGNQFYIGPDNGSITMLLERLEEQGEQGDFYELNQPQYWLSQVSHVFHGRDIFAPCAAHLAAGVPLERLGIPIVDPVRLDLPRPLRTSTGWQGEVIHIDHFGNLATNIRVEHLYKEDCAKVSLAGVEITGMVDTFGERPAGSLVALFGSTGNLIISVVNGSAARQLDVGIGEKIELTLRKKRSSKTGGETR